MITHQAAVPRRSCRQPAAAGAEEAREQRARRDHAAELKAVEDREIEALIKKQEDVGLQVGHRRRIPPRPGGTSISSGALDGVECYGWRARVPVRRRAHARRSQLARQQQARLLHAASDDRAFQVCGRAHQAHAEDDHPVAVGAATAARPRRGRRNVYPDVDDFYRDLGADLQQGGARFRRCRLPLSAARRDLSRHLCDPELPRADEGARRRSRDSSPCSTAT